MQDRASGPLHHASADAPIACIAAKRANVRPRALASSAPAQRPWPDPLPLITQRPPAHAWPFARASSAALARPQPARGHIRPPHSTVSAAVDAAVAARARAVYGSCGVWCDAWEQGARGRGGGLVSGDVWGVWEVGQGHQPSVGRHAPGFQLCTRMAAAVGLEPLLLNGEVGTQDGLGPRRLVDQIWPGHAQRGLRRRGRGQLSRLPWACCAGSQ